MNKNFKKFDLQLFADSEFFKKAFDEMYTPDENDYNAEHTDEDNNSDTTPEDVEEPESASNEEPELIVEDKIPTVENGASASDTSLTREEMLEAIKASQEKPKLDDETKQAVELMNFLKKNPHLIEAMQSVDPQGYQTLNNKIPDEMTKKMQEFEEFMVEQQYQTLVSTMKNKYSDYDADKVLNYADEKGITDLEVAYKALKADELTSTKPPSVDEIKAQLEKELREQIMAELKQDALNTQSIISQGDTVPPSQEEVALTQQENRVALALGIKPDEYAKWRDSK